MTIKWKQSKKVPTKCKNFDGWVTKIMVGRVCDKCSKEEEAFWGTVKASRERRGEETDYCYECSQKGRSMPKGSADKKWKHGKTHNGYTRITVDGKRVLEHTWVMESYLGRKLQKGETTHHIDMDKGNNTPSNLYLFESQADHQSCHVSMERCGYEMLGSYVWFDWENKAYTLTPQPMHLVYEPMLPLLKLHKQRYWVYRKKGDTQWSFHHVLVAETALGRKLYRDERVHHVDGDKYNNSIGNLCVMTKADHHRCHCALQRVVAELFASEIVQFQSGRYYVVPQVAKEQEHGTVALVV